MAKKEYVDLSKVRLYLQFLTGNQMDIKISEVIFRERGAWDSGVGMDKERFKALATSGGYRKNWERATKKGLFSRISCVMSHGGSLALLNQNEKDPEDIMFVPVSALEHLTLRFEEKG